MKKLYICEYPYILYTTLLKAAAENRESDMLLTNSINGMENMLKSIKQSGLFLNVYFYNDALFRETVSAVQKEGAKAVYSKNIFLKFRALCKGFFGILQSQHKAKGISPPVRLDHGTYGEIYCGDRVSTFMLYMNQNGISYGIVEHAKNIWQVKAESEIRKMELFYLLERLHLSRGICGYTKYCTSIEVTRNEGIKHFPKGKQITEWNVENAVAALSPDQKDTVYNIYADSYGLHLDYSTKYNLLLTNALYADAFVPTEQMQVLFYQDLINKYFHGENVLIKPHPRDTVNYKKYFANCIIVEPAISVEVLNLSKKLKLSTVLTLYSSSIHSFCQKAESLICLENDFSDASKMKSLKGYR